MEPRLIIAYSLLLLIAACFAAFVGYHIYHSRARSAARRLRRDVKQYERRMLEREDRSSK